MIFFLLFLTRMIGKGFQNFISMLNTLVVLLILVEFLYKKAWVSSIVLESLTNKPLNSLASLAGSSLAALCILIFQKDILAKDKSDEKKSENYFLLLLAESFFAIVYCRECLKFYWINACKESERDLQIFNVQKIDKYTLLYCF